MTFWIVAAIASAWVEVGSDCHGFYCGFAENSVEIRFHLGDCGSTDQCSSLYTCQDHLLWTATSWVVYVEDSLSARSAEEDCFWQGDSIYFKVLGEVAWNLGYPTALQFCYHPQTDGQTKRVNQILEDMLRACALQYGRSWDKSPSYGEFSYNDSYQESLKMALFEMLYGHRCRTSLFWSETGEWKVFRPDIL
jgi:hypothetical protein